MKIIISDKGQLEVTRLNIDFESMIQNVLKYVPKADWKEIAHIYVTSIPEDHREHQKGAFGAYYHKYRQHPAYIALYLRNLFGYLKDGKLSKHVLPVLEYGLAHTLFHEFGHHIEHTRSHGIKKKKKENYADSYAKKLINKYAIDKASSVDKCFKDLEKIFKSKGLSLDILSEMRNEWNLEFREALRIEGET